MTGKPTFWDSLSKPIFALAPMEDVTDTVFRQIVASCGRPDLFFTEFTNVDGLQSRGRKVVANRLKFSRVEHPIAAQLWGSKPENYYKTVIELVDAGFDGVDINMGCPEKKVISHGGCAALMNNPALAKEIIAAAKEAAAGKIPVSVKTRIGFKTIMTEQWIPFLLSLGLDALIIHGRTASELSRVPAHWDQIGRAVAIRNELGVRTFIIGNGDVMSLPDAADKVTRYGVDGVMIGRGVFENPWVFDRSHGQSAHSVREHLALMRKHVQLFEKTWGKKKPYAILKKFFKIYVKGFEGASEVRVRIMDTKNPKEVYTLLDELGATIDI